MQLDTENQLKALYILSKKDELFYYKQIYKYLNHLHILYRNGKLRDENKAFYIETSLSNCKSSMDLVENDLKKISNE